MKGYKIEKITFVSSGFKEILNSAGVEAIIREHTEATKARANANITEESVGYKSAYFHGGRVVGTVYTTDHASRVAEAEYKALSRAVR